MLPLLLSHLLFYFSSSHLPQWKKDRASINNRWWDLCVLFLLLHSSVLKFINVFFYFPDLRKWWCDESVVVAWRISGRRWRAWRGGGGTWMTRQKSFTVEVDADETRMVVLDREVAGVLVAFAGDVKGGGGVSS